MQGRSTDFVKSRQGPFVLAVVAGRCRFFSPAYSPYFLSPSRWDTAR